MATTKVNSDRPTYTTDFIQSDVDKAIFLGNPVLDNLVTSVIALGAEVWSNRRRTSILEGLLADKGVTGEMIETYMPSEEEEAAWQKDRDRFINATLSPLLREGELPISAPYEKS